jgi:hypothetical protein
MNHPIGGQNVLANVEDQMEGLNNSVPFKYD